MSQLDHHSGFTSSIIGGVVVILLGVGLATNVRERQNISSNTLEIQRLERITQGELEEIRYQHNHYSEQLRSTEGKAKKQTKDLQSYKA